MCPRNPDQLRNAGSGLADWLADRQQQADQHAERARAGAVGERRVAEALRTRVSDPDPCVPQLIGVPGTHLG